MELAPLATGVERRIDIGRGNPHAHWMSHDGKQMVTPNIRPATRRCSTSRPRIDAIVQTGARSAIRSRPA